MSQEDTYLIWAVKLMNSREGGGKPRLIELGAPWNLPIGAFKQKILDGQGLRDQVALGDVRIVANGAQKADDGATLMSAGIAQGDNIVCVLPAQQPRPTQPAAADAAPAAASAPAARPLILRRRSARRGGADSGGAAALAPSTACGICHEEDIPAASRAEIDCGHTFCFDCLKQWCETQNTCPTCRVRVESARRGAGGRRVTFEHRDREIDDEDTEGAENDDNFVSDSQVKCHGTGEGCACRWRNGEFDAKSQSEQLELQAENCSIECDGCETWYHIHCVGFESRSQVPSDDVEWLCPKCKPRPAPRAAAAAAPAPAAAPPPAAKGRAKRKARPGAPGLPPRAAADRAKWGRASPESDDDSDNLSDSEEEEYVQDAGGDDDDDDDDDFEDEEWRQGGSGKAAKRSRAAAPSTAAASAGGAEAQGGDFAPARVMALLCGAAGCGEGADSLSLGDLERAASSFEQFGTSEEEVESLFKLSGRETTERLTVEDLRTIMGIAFPSSIQEGGGTGKGKGKAKGRARGGARGNGKSATG